MLPPGIKSGLHTRWKMSHTQSETCQLDACAGKGTNSRASPHSVYRREGVTYKGAISTSGQVIVNICMRRTSRFVAMRCHGKGNDTN